MLVFPGKSTPETADISGLRAATMSTRPDACLGGAARTCWLLVAGLRSGRLGPRQRAAAHRACLRMLGDVPEADLELIWRQFFGGAARPLPLFHSSAQAGPGAPAPGARAGRAGTAERDDVRKRLEAALEALGRAAADPLQGVGSDVGLRREIFAPAPWH